MVDEMLLPETIKLHFGLRWKEKQLPVISEFFSRFCSSCLLTSQIIIPFRINKHIEGTVREGFYNDCTRRACAIKHNTK